MTDDEIRLNEKNGCFETQSKYGILVRNKGLFTDDCKKVLKVVQNANKRVFTIDGKRGLYKALEGYPVQMGVTFIKRESYSDILQGIQNYRQVETCKRLCTS